MVVHKFRKGSDMFSMCGKALHLTGGRGVKHWEITTCKHCLKHLKQKQEVQP
jgi:hypothetical protein